MNLGQPGAQAPFVGGGTHEMITSNTHPLGVMVQSIALALQRLETMTTPNDKHRWDGLASTLLQLSTVQPSQEPIERMSHVEIRSNAHPESVQPKVGRLSR